MVFENIVFTLLWDLDKKAKDREQWRKLVLALCASGRNKNKVGR